MRLYKIELFSLKIDDSYEKVILPIDNDYKVKDSLSYLDSIRKLSSLSPLSIELPDNRGLNQFSDLSCKLNVSYQLNSIFDYNYCCLYVRDNNTNNDLSADNIIFFFISSLESLNDSPNNPSCTLNLNYDFWANNYSKIYNSNSTGNQIRGHLKNNLLHEGNIATYNYKVNNGKQESYKSFTYGKCDNRYFPLFLKLIINYPDNGSPVESEYYNFYNNIEDKCSLESLFSSLYQSNVFYCPIGVFDTLTGSYIDGFINYTGEDIILSNGGTVKTTNRFIDYYSLTNNASLSSPYIRDAFYTFHAPFDYEFNLTGYTYEDGRKFPQLKFKGVPLSLASNLTLYGNLPIIALPKYEVNGISYTRSLMVQYFVLNSFKSKKTYTYDIFPEYINNDTEFSNLNFKCSISRYNEPYYNLEICINGSIYNIPKLKFSQGNKLKFHIDMTTIQPLCYITVSHDFSDNEYQIIFPNRFFLNKSPSITYTISALDDYLIRNGSQHGIELEIAKINRNNSIFNAIFDIPKSIIGGVESYQTGQVASNVFDYNMAKNNIVGANSALSSMISKGAGILSAVTSGVQSVGNLVYTIQLGDKQIDMYNAKIEDLSRHPSTPAHSQYGEGDIYFVDLPFFIISKQINDITEESIFFNEYRYGVDESIMIYLSDLNKSSFEYRKCSNIDLSISCNEIVKHMLSSLYKRGFTILYINDDNTNLNYGGDKIYKNGFNINTILNIDKEFIIDDEYKNLIGGIPV